MKNIRAYKSILEWQGDLEGEGYFVSTELRQGIEQAMEMHDLSFADAYMLLVERGVIIPVTPSKQNLDSQLRSVNSSGKRGEICDALDRLEDAKGDILGRKIRMDIKDDIHAYFNAMDYFYKNFPYSKDAEVEFAEEMKKFDEFVVYARKLTERIRQYEANNKPNRIIVHKYKFPDLK